MVKIKKLFIDEYNLPWSISHYIQRNMHLVEIDSGIELGNKPAKIRYFLITNQVKD